MKVFSKPIVREFVSHYPDSESALNSWYKIMKKTNFETFSQLKAVFSSIDKYGTCFIFDIGGNKYRLIAKIHFERRKLYIRNILTHKEYDKERWKHEC